MRVEIAPGNTKKSAFQGLMYILKMVGHSNQKLELLRLSFLYKPYHAVIWSG
jgi:hypothetical protein